MPALVDKNKTNNIFLIGPMGAGKTTIGRNLARVLKMDFYDSDQVIEERTGADILWIYDIEGEEGFRKREIQVIAELTKLRGIVLATGGGTIVEEANGKELQANGIVVYLKTSFEDQLEHTKRSKKRPLSKDKIERGKTLRTLRATREPIYEKLADIVCATHDKDLRHIVSEIARQYKKLTASANS